MQCYRQLLATPVLPRCLQRLVLLVRALSVHDDRVSCLESARIIDRAIVEYTEDFDVEKPV